MNTEQNQESKVLEYKFRPIKILDQPGEYIEIFAYGEISDISNDEFIGLCEKNGLRVGLFLYHGDSTSGVLAEFRAIQVMKGSDAGTFRAKFSIPRDLFAEQQCRLAKIDLLYEHKFWFEEKLGPRPILPIWVEKSAKELDVFEYYRTKYIKN